MTSGPGRGAGFEFDLLPQTSGKLGKNPEVNGRREGAARPKAQWGSPHRRKVGRPRQPESEGLWSSTHPALREKGPPEPEGREALLRRRQGTCGVHRGREEPPQPEHRPPQAHGTRKVSQGPPEGPAHLFRPYQASRAGCERNQLSPPTEHHRPAQLAPSDKNTMKPSTPLRIQNTPHDSKDLAAPQEDGTHTQGQQNSSQLMHMSQEGRREAGSQQGTNRTKCNQ